MKILYIAPLGNYSVAHCGYGNASVSILNVLIKLKYQKKIDKIDVISTLNIEKEEIPYITELYDIAILITHPSSFSNKDIKEKLIKLLYKAKNRFLNILWETIPLPKDWEWMWDNELFTGFLAPSKFIYDQLIINTKKPIFYIPYYFNIDDYKKINIKDKVYEDKFTVLYIGQYTKRKGLEDSVISFVRALGDKEDCQLILKYHDMSQREIPLDTFVFHLVQCNILKLKAKIFSLTEKLNKNEIMELYKESSCLLFISRGEGFGMPGCEAMCIGLPVIYTNWSALPEIFENSRGNIAIPYVLETAYGMAHHKYETDSMYALPSIKSTMDALQKKYKEWKENKINYYEQIVDNDKIVDEKYGFDSIVNYLTLLFNYVWKGKL